MACRARAPLALGGDPQAGRAAQVVGGRGVGTGAVRLQPCGETLDGGRSGTVTAIIISLDAVTVPDARSKYGIACIVLVLALPGEGFDSTAEVMVDRASDNDAFDGPIG